MPSSLTRLDAQVEAVLGASIATLHAQDDLAPDAARIVDAHRALTRAETTVAFERVRLLICADRQRRVDDGLLTDLDTQLETLEDAAAARDQAETDLLARLREMRHRPARCAPAPADAAAAEASAGRR
ncbi:hypothetical protein ACFVVU_30610 [Kitasatospora sp. NPDC057965]|uniref:hypothetical protein n=1 Tax=Kitasatospora sp. NPDC057965 TaxID=3346291 RepID=UPI0036DC8EE1